MKQAQDTASCVSDTRSWIQNVVIGLNLCPFAAPVMRQDALLIRAISGDLQTCLINVAQACAGLEQQAELDTILLVLDNGYEAFEDYLELVELSEQLLDDAEYAGVFQIASFHPHYQFAGSDKNDVENYTNRSPFPILQLLRESSVSRALTSYPNAADIPERNMQCMRSLGVDAMRKLLEA